MNFVPNFFSQNRVKLEELQVDLSTFEKELRGYEKSEKVGLTRERLTAGKSRSAVERALMLVGRCLRYATTKEDIQSILTNSLLKINCVVSTAIRFVSMMVLKTSQALYARILEFIPGREPIQLVLFDSSKYTKDVPKTSNRRPKKQQLAVEPISVQLSLFSV